VQWVFGSVVKMQSEKQRQQVYSTLAVKGFQSLRDGCAALDGGRIVVPKAGDHCVQVFLLRLALNLFKSSLYAKV